MMDDSRRWSGGPEQKSHYLLWLEAFVVSATWFDAWNERRHSHSRIWRKFATTSRARGIVIFDRMLNEEPVR